MAQPPIVLMVSISMHHYTMDFGFFFYTNYMYLKHNSVTANIVRVECYIPHFPRNCNTS